MIKSVAAAVGVTIRQDEEKGAAPSSNDCAPLGPYLTYGRGELASSKMCNCNRTHGLYQEAD